MWHQLKVCNFCKFWKNCVQEFLILSGLDNSNGRNNVGKESQQRKFLCLKVTETALNSVLKENYKKNKNILDHQKQCHR